MVLLVGGDEKRGAALKIASPSLEALSKLLSSWRGEARLRVLSDELGLGDGVHAEVEVALETLKDAAAMEVVEIPVTTQTGRLLRELIAIHAAVRASGVKVPQLKVRAALAASFN